jgi:hypothetical protein
MASSPSTPATTCQRHQRTTLATLGLLALLLLAGCSLPWQQSNTASALGPHPSSAQLLAALQKSFRSVTSFHVMMRVRNQGHAASNQIQITSADGDVVMPDRVKAQATVILDGQAVTVDLVSIGKQQFITDPITGQWRAIKGVIDPRTFTNPDTGLISLASRLQQLSEPNSDQVNGVACWRVNGLLDAKYLAFFTGGGVPAGTLLHTSVWIGQSDTLPYRLDVTGIAAKGDTPQTTRTFLLSKYNENVTISAPQI